MTDDCIIRDKKRGIQYRLRGYISPEDDGVIISPWCYQIRSMKPWRSMDKDTFEDYKEDFIEPLIARCSPVIACRTDDIDRVYGWCCGEVLPGGKNVLHMCYVKNTFRCLGIGSKLISMTLPGFRRRQISYTHQTKAMRGYLAKHWDAIYEPELTRKHVTEIHTPGSSNGHGEDVCAGGS